MSALCCLHVKCGCKKQLLVHLNSRHRMQLVHSYVRCCDLSVGMSLLEGVIDLHTALRKHQPYHAEQQQIVHSSFMHSVSYFLPARAEGLLPLLLYVTSSVCLYAGSSLSTEITGWNWTYLTTSSAWNLQVGSRLQWLGPSTSLVLFNDRDCHQAVLQTSRRLATSLDVQVFIEKNSSTASKTAETTRYPKKYVECLCRPCSLSSKSWLASCRMLVVLC